MTINRKNLLKTALYSPDKVQTGNWTAQRHRGRPQCVLVYHGTKVIMEVDLAKKTVTPLTHKKQGSKEMASITMMLTSAGITDPFIPSKKGIGV
jgi:Cu/Ag efflux protein CusF